MGNSDTIAAIATPPGRGGIGVVRISGRDSKSLAQKIVGYIPQPRHASLSKFLGDDGSVIDEGIVLFFPAPHSYTGEDILELQGHGGPAVMNLLLASCLSAGARLAQPGEFTLRAFLNNKLDLAQAEGVADIIDASSGEAARCAVRSLQGEFSSVIHSLVQALTDLRLLVEASLDFPEEEIDLPHQTEVGDKLGRLQAQLQQVFVTARQGNLLREGVWVILVGQPNVGKSSLLNKLAGEEAAIVTEVPGTTRDTIRQTIELEGVPVHLVDTAGLRETDDMVEKMGISRTRSVIEKADLVLLLMDSRQGITPDDQAILVSLPARLPVLHVYNKIDLLDRLEPAKSRRGSAEVYLSAKTGAGIESLRQKLLEMAGWRPQSMGEGVLMARQRHLRALFTAREHLENAAALLGKESDLLAEELRLAQKALSSTT